MRYLFIYNHNKPMMSKPFAFLLILFSLQSCAYSWRKVETDSGEKQWVKQYKSNTILGNHSNRYEFIGYYRCCKPKESYVKYSGAQKTDTINGSIFIQYDSANIFFDPDSKFYSTLFTHRILSRQIILNAFQCNMFGWDKNDIFISDFKILRFMGSLPTQRKFIFCANSGNFGPSKETFFVEITNDKASRWTNLKTFIEGARLTFFMVSPNKEI